MNKITALIATGYGINCDGESAHACEKAGAAVLKFHLNELFNDPKLLRRGSLLVFPGGFSYGDDLGAGKALSNRIHAVKDTDGTTLYSHLQNFVDRGGCILGICNGFQLLVSLGLLPCLRTANHTVFTALTTNQTGKFLDTWVTHEVHPSPSIFLQGISSLKLPIRHKEGRLVTANEEIRKMLWDQQQIPLTYADPNPNGSQDSIAALCDPKGRILGMMAHPEAALYANQIPGWTSDPATARDAGPGFRLFSNAIRHLEENL